MLFTAGVAFLATSAKADEIYTYTGNHFTYVNPPGDGSVVYTGSDYVSVTLDFATELPDNLTFLTEVSPLSFSFSDGYQTITNTSYGGNYASFVQMATSDTGLITSWSVGISIGGEIESRILTYNYPAQVSDFAEYSYYGHDASGGNRNDPGIWTSFSTDPVGVPGPDLGSGIPGALAAFGLMGFGYWKKRRNQALVA
jgi:hypothetical protein